MIYDWYDCKLEIELKLQLITLYLVFIVLGEIRAAYYTWETLFCLSFFICYCTPTLSLEFVTLIRIEEYMDYFIILCLKSKIFLGDV